MFWKVKWSCKHYLLFIKYRILEAVMSKYLFVMFLSFRLNLSKLTHLFVIWFHWCLHYVKQIVLVELLLCCIKLNTFWRVFKTFGFFFMILSSDYVSLNFYSNNLPLKLILIQDNQPYSYNIQCQILSDNLISLFSFQSHIHDCEKMVQILLVQLKIMTWKKMIKNII